jgi:BirA family biotin operon repressor/biotin-[acetyl-CoA-carboxylase] ligase
MRRMDKKIIVLNETDSSNNYANELILSDAAEEGTVVLTQFQLKGKGQVGNHWESEAGKNLLASIVLFPKFLNAGKQFLLSKLISLALVEFLQNEIGDVLIKWPNDIYVGNKKIAGILIENKIKGNNLYSSVLGIGLNLNQLNFFSDAPNPVSLKQITGKEYNARNVLEQILEIFFNWYGKLNKGNLHEVDLAYYSQLFRREKWDKYSANGVEFEARIAGIGEFGQLQLEKRSGEILEFMFKEVEFVL